MNAAETRLAPSARRMVIPTAGATGAFPTSAQFQDASSPPAFLPDGAAAAPAAPPASEVTLFQPAPASEPAGAPASEVTVLQPAPEVRETMPAPLAEETVSGPAPEAGPPPAVELAALPATLSPSSTDTQQDSPAGGASTAVVVGLSVGLGLPLALLLAAAAWRLRRRPSSPGARGGAAGGGIKRSGSAGTDGGSSGGGKGYWSDEGHPSSKYLEMAEVRPSLLSSGSPSTGQLPLHPMASAGLYWVYSTI